MYRFTLLILFLCAANTYGQAVDSLLTVDYSYVIQNEGNGPRYETLSRLTATYEEVLYEIDHLGSFEDAKPQDDKTISFSIPSKGNDFVFTDYQEGAMYYSDRIQIEKTAIKTPIDSLMQWSFEDGTKKLMGYNCKVAVAEYGGRYYIAHYTSELPFKGGPWRFVNLPGVVLGVRSADGYFSLRATEIKVLKNQESTINNPFEGKALISWEQFLANYKKEYDRILKEGMREWGPSTRLPKKRIIEFIKD